jgi:hypothetical protein
VELVTRVVAIDLEWPVKAKAAEPLLQPLAELD